jgi:hypothetical protein
VACAHLAVLSRPSAVPREVLSLLRQTRVLVLHGMVVVTLILNETDVKSTSPLCGEQKKSAKMTKV